MLTPLLIALALTADPGYRPDAPPTHEVDTARFRIHATDAAMNTARLLSAELESDRDFIATRLGADYPGITDVRVGEGVDEMLRLEPPQSDAPRWAAGTAHPGSGLIVLDAQALRREGGIGLVRHELAHVALGALGSPELPRWFQEGVAVTAAAEWSTESALSMMRAAKEPIPLSQLERGFPEGYGDVQLAYAESASFVQYLYTHYGTGAVHALVEGVHAGTPFDAAFAKAFEPREVVEAKWLKSVRLLYSWIPVATGSTTVFAVAALLCVAAWSRVRRRQTARMAELALEEQAFDAAERIRLAEAAAAPQLAPAQEGVVEPMPPPKPTVH